MEARDSGTFVLNALQEWRRIEARIAGRRTVLFLDYDGTLSPIVADPERAYMLDGMRETLRDVSSHVLTAIVTGRSSEKIRNFVQLEDIFYAASHGFDIHGPLDVPVVCRVAERYRPVLEAARDLLSARLEHIEGHEIEDNAYSISVHYRRVPSAEGVEELVRVVNEEMPGLRAQGLTMKHGKKVLELRPDVDWNKGMAVKWILEALGLNTPDTFALYLGDDVSDEDAFQALGDLPGGGCGILVRADDDRERTAETAAHFKLRDPSEVHLFLQNLHERVPGGTRPQRALRAQEEKAAPPGKLLTPEKRAEPVPLGVPPTPDYAPPDAAAAPAAATPIQVPTHRAEPAFNRQCEPGKAGWDTGSAASDERSAGGDTAASSSTAGSQAIAAQSAA